jgi:hypothetical protein
LKECCNSNGVVLYVLSKISKEKFFNQYILL